MLIKHSNCKIRLHCNFAFNVLITKEFLFFILLLLISCVYNNLYSQGHERSHKSRRGELDTIHTVYVSKDKLKKIEAYGSLRMYMGVSYDGYLGVEDGLSHLGVTGTTNVIRNINAFVLLELGINGIDNNLDLVFHADPGGSAGELNHTVTSRLSVIGFETPIGKISWGKQWSPYYDIGGFSDLSLAFGGEAQGTYPSGTDGGIAGTGRAANSMQYRTKVKNFKLGLQAQFRDLSDNDVKFADTYAASLIYENPFGISLGVAYNKVLDGVDMPNINQSKVDDEAAIAGLFFQKKGFTFAGTFSVLKNHERDDQGFYLDANGIEAFVLYEFLNKWSALSGINYLKPYGNDHGEYQIKYLMLGISYYFTKTSLVFLETKIEDSRNVDGAKRKSILGFGIHYDF